MKPHRALGDTRTRVLLAVIGLRRPTVRRVAEDAGLSIANAHRHLMRLRDDGLVAWEPGRKSTLHALVDEVAR